MQQTGRGKFITMEGGEGSGKSTQISLLVDAFEQADLCAIQTREPGGTDGAEAIRDLLVQGDAARWDPIAETLLFYAARRQHLAKVVWPEMALGTYVVCDRFADSTRVYQGAGKGLGDEYVMELHRLTIGTFQPDLTIWLDIHPQQGLERTQKRGNEAESRFENTKGGFHERVHAGFAELTKKESARMVRIDATQSIDEIHHLIIDEVNKRLGLSLQPVERTA